MLPFIGLFTAKLNLPEQQLVQSIQVTITRQHHTRAVPCNSHCIHIYLSLNEKVDLIDTHPVYARHVFDRRQIWQPVL